MKFFKFLKEVKSVLEDVMSVSSEWAKSPIAEAMGEHSRLVTVLRDQFSRGEFLPSTAAWAALSVRGFSAEAWDASAAYVRGDYVPTLSMIDGIIDDAIDSGANTGIIEVLRAVRADYEAQAALAEVHGPIGANLILIANLMSAFSDIEKQEEVSANG